MTTTHGIALKRALARLSQLPVHPQWLVFRQEAALQATINRFAQGFCLDVGCGRRRLSPRDDPNFYLVRLDYPETGSGYGAMPDVWASADHLPITDNAVDSVLLLDVVEHLREPELALQEAKRVLKNNGHCVIQMPFMYPLHDAPNDFQRWTEHRFLHVSRKLGLDLVELRPNGTSFETAALTVNLALAELAIHALGRSLILGALALVAVAPLFGVFNVLGWTLGKIRRDQSLMPLGYTVVLRKSSSPVA